MPPSIFQQIVLPYLAHRAIPTPRFLARFISSSIARSRAPANTDPSSSSTLDSTTRAWDYVPPIAPVPFNPGHDPPEKTIPWRTRQVPLPVTNRGVPGREALAFLKSLEDVKGGRKETLLLALERLAAISGRQEEERLADLEKPVERDVTKPKRRLPDEIMSLINEPTVPIGPTPGLPPTTLDAITTPTESIESQPQLDPQLFPHVIYTLLRARLYRLAVYHLLQTPEYAVDQPLLDRVAECMRTEGAGKLARRLERGWDGTFISRDTPLPQLPLGSTRLPPSTWLISRRAAARPLPESDALTLASLTANYNAHLTRALLSPKKGSSSSTHSSNPLSPLNNLLTNSQPLQRPSGGMRQLRQLLKKIERLESHRRFRPDWVTANLVIKCWMNCLTAAGQGWKAGGVRGLDQGEIDKRMELRGLFAFVKVLFEKEVQERAERGKTQLNPDVHAPPQAYPYPLTLSYTRHIRPFASDLIRASRQIDDRKGVQQIIEWQKEIRDKMEALGEEKTRKSKLHPRRR